MSAPSDTETLNGEFGSKKLTLDNEAIRVNIELGPGKTDIGGIWRRAGILGTKCCG